ncbi:TonB-dependent receptor [Sphingomonas psychrotolerans]|uniref:TonB-dependent receptor n=1 Tax=Sphingomonas psychrotolerans TaxID=1327635 RepID=A0ABU3N2Z5_9SPHN|nr:TonB-dependent receptor [Sphingomonas psychrotolerans]MDT8758907.1 TonB-dependent receptor [Sphingomonas psychrotolerans]
MKRGTLFLAAAPVALVFAMPAFAGTTANESAPAKTDATAAEPQAEAPAKKQANEEVFSTGVAKGRDRLDSATSTSALRASEIDKLGARSIAEILRDIPGIRSEAASGEGNGNITIRGLPIASTGAKFLQLQEDGLPILEFGDISFAGADAFLRADLNLAAVEAIRGGSASTFASNSPGGIVNFISKTGDVEGGSVQLSGGLDYGMRRVDFDYGTKISDTLRFHVGGFYRDGEGPRNTGFNTTQGGQIKLNVTKEFAGGYVRFYGKYLDDRSPIYDVMPVAVSGTNSDPEYGALPGFDPRHDTMFTRNFQRVTQLDGNNNVSNYENRNRVLSKSFGIEGKIEVAGWDIIEKFRYADMSGHFMSMLSGTVLPAAALAPAFGAPGGTIRYATGPNAGQTIANPTTLNGNGLAGLFLLSDVTLNGVDNVTNDIRASKVWNLGGPELTTTVGLYSSHQTIDTNWAWSSVLSDINGGGNGHLLDIVTPTGVKLTQDGVLAYGLPGTSTLRRTYDMGYTTNAPFGSVNLRLGKLAIGGSIRYDMGTAKGTLIGADLGGGRVGLAPKDMNGDGAISVPESHVAVLPLTTPGIVDYKYDYVSYSVGVNYRIAEPVAVFARYSRGGRANADRLLFSPIVNTDGSLLFPEAAVDTVKQAEGGVKYRNGGLTLNLTGFWAKAEDTNIDSTNGNIIAREYKAVGAEFEGGYRAGIFSLTAGATYTDAEITKDFINPALVGNIPHHQAKFIFQATPQITTDSFNVGATFIGTTGSYATDDNLLKVPGFVTTNAFVQFRPVDRVTLAVNASNLFDVLAITAIDDRTLPATGVAKGHVLTGRTISASVRFDF